MLSCPDCGAENEADAAFCGSCGARLGGGPPPPSPHRPAGQGPRWAALGGLVALIVLAAGTVALYDEVGRNGEWRERLFGGGEEQRVAAGPSPIVSAAPTPTAAAPSPTASALPEPTATRVPTVAPQPTVSLQPTPTPPPTPVPPAAVYATPEEAIGAHLEQYALQYAGDCALTDLETDVGLYCSTMWEDRGRNLIYAVGLTFSEYEAWLLLADQGGGAWLVVDEAEFVPGPGAPVPPWP